MVRVVVRTMLRWVMRLLFRVSVVGDVRQFDANRLLIIANHESFLDGLLLGLFLPVAPVFVVHTWVAQNPIFRLLLGMVDYLAVDPTSPLAMKKVIKLVEAGRPVMIFPEGRITVTGSMMKVYDGPAFVAAKTGATLVPVRLDGPARSYFSRMSGNYPRYLFPRITLSVQKHTQIAMPEAANAKLRRRLAGEEMRHIMQIMLFDSHPKQTLYSGLIDAMELWGRSHRLVEDVRQVEHSYGQILKNTLAMARLTSKFTRPEETVGILMPNMAMTLSLLVGLSAFRRVPAMLNYTAGSDGLRNACVAGNIRTVITSRKFIETAKLQATVTGLQGIDVKYLEDLQPTFTLGDKLWLMGFALWFPRLAAPKAQAEEPAVVLFTSGSEGKPKGVVLSHKAILSNIAQIRSVIDFSVDDKLFNALPIFHSFGLTAGALLPLFTGVRLFLYPSPLHYRIIPELVYDRNCTILYGTSTFLANYAKFAHPYDFNRLRYVIAGAEKLSDAVRTAWFEKFGIRIFEGYGATETAPVLAVNTPMAYRSGSVGQLLPGIKARLVPVPGIERGGLLHVHGPNVMSGYYRYESPGVLEPAYSEVGAGWYNTGDIVEFDKEGYLSIVGRVKRFAKVAGEMVSLEVVEKIAIAASGVMQHAASSQTDAARGEAIVLFTTDSLLTRDMLLESARHSGYPELAVPRKIVNVSVLPLLGTGKVDYVTLKSMAEGLV